MWWNVFLFYYIRKVAYSNNIFPFNGKFNFILPGLVPRLEYFRHQYQFEVTPTKGKGEVYFEFEKHSIDEYDDSINVFNDISFFQMI